MQACCLECLVDKGPKTTSFHRFFKFTDPAELSVAFQASTSSGARIRFALAVG
jgi:hypothetical protein